MGDRDMPSRLEATKEAERKRRGSVMVKVKGDVLMGFPGMRPCRHEYSRLLYAWYWEGPVIEQFSFLYLRAKPPFTGPSTVQSSLRFWVLRLLQS